jgi:hypothetical protein
MTLAESYRILGLEPGCTEQEIKRSFKKLARTLHPDVNPDPKAHEQFIRLTKALEVVLNPPIEKNQPSGRTSRAQKPTASPEETLDRMREAKARYEKMEQRKKHENETYFYSLTSGKRLKALKVVMYVGAIISFFFITETVLPYHQHEDELLSRDKRLYNGIMYTTIEGITLKNKGSYYCEYKGRYWDSMYPEVIIESSWFSHTPIRMIQNDDYEVGITNFDFHLGSLRWLIVLILLCPLIPYFRPKRTIFHVFIFYFSIYMVGIIELYILLTNNRIVHFLTLGFF